MQPRPNQPDSEKEGRGGGIGKLSRQGETEDRPRKQSKKHGVAFHPSFLRSFNEQPARVFLGDGC